MNRGKIWQYLFLLFLSIFFIVIWYNINGYIHPKPIGSGNLIERQLDSFEHGFVFINPLLECNVDFNFFNTNNLEEEIKAYIATIKEQNKLTDIWVYFRLLKNGSIFWIWADTEFVSASLTKLPLAMTYYKSLELWLLSANGEISVPMDYKTNLDRNIWADNIRSWNKYTAEELIEQMLVNSDNTAAEILGSHIWWENINLVYKDLWIPQIDFTKNEDIRISTRDISRFLRILYNASYLNQAHSEEILKFLSKSNFKDGIRKWIPGWILVLNKFGERWFPNSQEKQLHDCWIIYANQNPYLLCVMTKWNDLKVLSSIIWNISKITFDTINEMKKE